MFLAKASQIVLSFLVILILAPINAYAAHVEREEGYNLSVSYGKTSKYLSSYLFAVLFYFHYTSFLLSSIPIY
jgi:hypothetical protein